MTQTYENLPKILKLLLQLVFGALIGGIYRIAKFLETKNLVTLVAGVLNFVGLGLIFWIVDLFTEATSNKITFLAD